MSELLQEPAMRGPGGEPAFATKASDVRQIPRELTRQAVALDQLHSLLSVLEDRLGPIRLPKPQPEGEDIPELAGADLANQIARATAAVESATRRVHVLLAEVEV